VFFEQSFNLADPKTFAKVTEQPDDLRATPSSSSRPSSSSGLAPVDHFTDPTSSLSYTPPLLDKFSHYADTVEQHLVREISIRSTSFFAALTNLQDLQSESDVCLDRISQLRELLRDVDEKTAMKGLDVVKKSKKVGNVVKVKEVAKGIEGVVEMTRVAKGFVGAGQWGEALTVVEELERLWNGETPKDVKVNGGGLESMPEEDENDNTSIQQDRKPTIGFPLSALAAFSELPSHLQALTLEIATSLSQELVIVLRHDLEQRVLRYQNSQDIKSNGHAPDPKAKDETLRDRLKPLLHDLVRTKGLKDAILKWREDVLGEVKSVVRKAVSGFDEEWEEDKEENK
jgi:vacuolar protein sorting-associated protein 54